MPYYAGFHPYFLTPPAGQGKEKVLLDYQPIGRLSYNDELTDIMGQAPLFALPAAVTDRQINEQLTLVGDNKTVRVRFPDGNQLYMQASGVEDPNLFPYIQLYTLADKPFICVEPWMSFPNALNSANGVRWLSPGQKERGILQLSLNK